MDLAKVVDHLHGALAECDVRRFLGKRFGVELLGFKQHGIS